MDRTITTVAQELGTSVHRVSRAVERLGIKLSEPKNPGRGRPVRVIEERDVEFLRADLGVTPWFSGFAREELFVLAALDADKRGFESIRSLAEAAGISPTTAGRVVRRLEDRGLVSRRQGFARMNGRVKDATLFTANHSEATWRDVESLLAATRPPSPAPGLKPSIVPRRFWHLFWNAKPAALRVNTNADFIAARLLLSNDQRAVAWAATHLPATSIEKTADVRGVSNTDREWIRELAAARQRR
jgi:transposase